MVVFTCGHCGESVQKPKVEKHYMTKCRNRDPNLSCMDCFKDFFGHDYESHTKCITEEERYSGKGFVAKEKKGEQKQNVWVEMVQSVLDEQKTAPRNILRIIESVSKHTNTPRKKPKFINFVKNVCGHKTNPQDIEQAWNLLSAKLSALNPQSKNPIQLKQSDELNNSVNEENANDSNIEEQNGDIEVSTELKEIETVQKKSKKEKKEEKKKKKYEAELQSAAEPSLGNLEDQLEDITLDKKDKKSKNKVNDVESASNINDVNKSESKSRKSKRKRVETINEIDVISQNEAIPITVPKNVKSDKPNQKKPRANSNTEVNETMNLHDQNVAATEHFENKDLKFDWHATIISVLQKKGNDIQFKRLQKKVLGEYSDATGNAVDDRIADKFIKKLKSAPRVKVDKNRVFLED